MIKFNKDFNTKIISILVTVSFLFNSTVYGVDISAKSHLRVPLGDYKRIETAERREGESKKDNSIVVELVTVPVDEKERQVALEGCIAYQDFIAIMTKDKSAKQFSTGEIYAIADIGTQLGRAQVQKSLLKGDNAPLMALYALLAKAITLVAANPRVLYAGLGIGAKNSVFDLRFPLLATDFEELIGVEKQWISYDDFRNLVILELDGLVEPGNIIFNESEQSTSEEKKGIYEARFKVFGKSRLIRGYYGEKYDLNKFIPTEIKERYNVLIDRIGFTTNELKIQLFDLLQKDAGFILDWSLHEPKLGINGRLNPNLQTGNDFGGMTNSTYETPQLCRLLSEDLYIHNLAGLKLKKFYHMLHLLAFPETLAQLKKASGSKEAVQREYPLGKTVGALNAVIGQDLYFADKYRAFSDSESRIEFLLEQYQMSDVKVDIEIVPPYPFVPKGSGMMDKIGPKHYKITLIGVEDIYYQEYVLFHEFMHVWLKENGFTFSWDVENVDIANYLYRLRNLIEDYLIEKENRRRFGSYYSGALRDLRDADLQDKFSFMDDEKITDNIWILMLAITSKAVSLLYPELSDSLSAKLIGKIITGGGLKEIMPVIAAISIDNSVAEYERTVITVHNLLTEDDAKIKDGIISVNTTAVTEFVSAINTLMTQIRGLNMARQREMLRRNMDESL